MTSHVSSRIALCRRDGTGLLHSRLDARLCRVLGSMVQAEVSSDQADQPQAGGYHV